MSDLQFIFGIMLSFFIGFLIRTLIYQYFELKQREADDQ
jgi:hypothetical protein